KKVKLAFIANDSSRKTTFKKRKKGLLKKVNEVSTLCGITACAIIYSPYSNPEVWPSNSCVQMVVSDFQTLPKMDQHKKMVDQELFLKQRIAKTFEHLKNQKKNNREMEITKVIFQYLLGNTGMFHVNTMDLNNLGYLIEQYLKDINRMIEILGNTGIEIGNAAAIATTTTVPTTAIHEVAAASSATISSSAPHVEFYEQTRNLNQNHNQNQKHLFMEIMIHPEQITYGVKHMSFPFIDDNHRNHHQQQQIPSDSSKVPTIVSSSNIIPVY
ncbi:hypothetical protein EUTSA_v10024162mg, partial [Eutrema salsugineum]